MSTSQLSEFLSAASNNPALQQALESEGVNPIEIATQAGFTIDQSDLDELRTTVVTWEKSSPELRSFLEAVAQRPELQARLRQPGSDPMQIAAELGISLNTDEMAQLSPDVIELDDAALSQVVGGIIEPFTATAAGIGAGLLTGFSSLMLVSTVAAVALVGGAVIAGGALAVGLGVAAYNNRQG